MRIWWKQSRSPPVVRVFFALVALVFTCVYPYRTWVNNPNENVRTYMTMAIVEEHTFCIDKLVQRYGWVNDMASVPEPDGSKRLFSVKAPAASYAGVPFYWLMTKVALHFGYAVPTDATPTPERQSWFEAVTFVLRLFSVQIPCFVFLLWFERWLRATSSDPVLRLSAVAAAGIGTNYLAYSLTFASHAQFAVTAFASFAITLREQTLHPLDPSRRRMSRAFLAGLFAGLATLFEYHALFVSVCLAIYALTVFWRPSRLATFGAGGLLSVLALCFFQWRAFKNPLTPGHKMSENPIFAHNLSQGLFGMTKPDLDVFKNMSFNLGYGFFGTSPFMWLGLLAIPYAIVAGFGSEREQRQRRTATIVWMLTMLVLWTGVSAQNNWRGGWTVGPRYLGAAPPFFAFGALCALEALAARSATRRAIVRGVAGGAALASVFTIGLVGLHYTTLPEDFTRPFAQMTWPMALAGFVPHHALELFGVKSSAFWYVVAGCAVGATCLAALAPWREEGWTWPLRGAVFLAVFVVAMVPAFSEPALAERGDLGEHSRHSFANGWEPHGRDRITTLREEAERYGPRRPCLWARLAHLEQVIGMNAEAQADQAKGNVAPGQCTELADRFDRMASPPAPSLDRAPIGRPLVRH
jgi:hypothetical protein